MGATNRLTGSTIYGQTEPGVPDAVPDGPPVAAATESATESTATDSPVEDGAEATAGPAEGSGPAVAEGDASDVSTADMRAWATANGFQVAPTGRLPQDVVTAYQAAVAAKTAEGGTP